ncbi:MAG: hypothetical protein K2Z80_30395 [Xanthobacteraceae bacterium]|nr:hypothetical protein [Xanthobacteraceae bacterium]
MEKPLIIRAMMSADWHAAFVLVSQAAFQESAGRLGLTASPDVWAIKTPDKIARDSVRKVCLQSATDAANRDLAAAWRMLGAPPYGYAWRSSQDRWVYYQVLKALAQAVDDDPALLDDDKTCEAIQGWQFLEQAGSDGEQDLIVAAQQYGAFFKVDREKLRGWATSRAREDT